jgi:hypothetical protein
VRWREDQNGEETEETKDDDDYDDEDENEMIHIWDAHMLNEMLSSSHSLWRGDVNANARHEEVAVPSGIFARSRLLALLRIGWIEKLIRNPIRRSACSWDESLSNPTRSDLPC